MRLTALLNVPVAERSAGAMGDAHTLAAPSDQAAPEVREEPEATGDERLARQIVSTVTLRHEERFSAIIDVMLAMDRVQAEPGKAGLASALQAYARARGAVERREAAVLLATWAMSEMVEFDMQAAARRVPLPKRRSA